MQPDSARVHEQQCMGLRIVMAMYRRFHPCMQQSAATGRASQWLMGRPQADKFPNKPWEHPFDGTHSRYIEPN